MGLNEKIVIVRTIALNLDADDWRLYNPKAGSARSVARQMNVQVSAILNAYGDVESMTSIRRRCGDVMSSYAKHGATDSECIQVMDRILRRFFA